MRGGDQKHGNDWKFVLRTVMEEFVIGRAGAGGPNCGCAELGDVLLLRLLQPSGATLSSFDRFRRQVEV